MNREELLKIARPILFNTEMVKAILDDRKSVTRRIIKGLGNNLHIDKPLGDWALSEKPYIKDGLLYWELQTYVDDSRVFKSKLPYQVGDILYVRETFNGPHYQSGYKNSSFLYKADLNTNIALGGKWKPSIHMPKSAARIFLKVTDVRVEKLRDITNQEAHKEGIIATGSSVLCEHGTAFNNWDFSAEKFIDTFLKIYPNCTEESYLWIIEFERVR